MIASFYPIDSTISFKIQSKESCDEVMFESNIKCLKGYFICNNGRFDNVDSHFDGSRLKGTREFGYLQLSQLKTACPNGLYSLIDSKEVQSLGLKTGTEIQIDFVD